MKRHNILSTKLYPLLMLGTLLPSLLMPADSFAASQNIFLDLDLTSKLDDNINQAKLDSDSVEDTITSASFLIGYQHSLNTMSALNIGAGLKTVLHKEVQSQDSKSALFNLAYIWQRSISYRAPLYQVSINSEIHNNNTKQQDSTIINAQFIASSRITDVITLTGGLGYKMRDSESTVYDLDDQRIFISSDYSLSKKTTFYGTVSLVRGDIFSIIRPDTDEELYIALAAGKENIQWDDAYNQEFPSEVTPWRAYKLGNADTRVLVLGMNYGIGHATSFDLSYTYANVSATADANYQRNIISGSLLKRF